MKMADEKPETSKTTISLRKETRDRLLDIKARMRADGMQVRSADDVLRALLLAWEG